MTTEEKFHAAVNVIRSLPKNGMYKFDNCQIIIAVYTLSKRYNNKQYKQLKNLIRTQNFNDHLKFS